MSFRASFMFTSKFEPECHFNCTAFTSQCVECVGAGRISNKSGVLISCNKKMITPTANVLELDLSVEVKQKSKRCTKPYGRSCGVCGVLFFMSSELYAHIKTVHNLHIFFCTNCNSNVPFERYRDHYCRTDH
jgi:hypothetical protein